MYWIDVKRGTEGAAPIRQIEPGYFSIRAHKRFNIRPDKKYWLDCSDAWSFSSGDYSIRLELVKALHWKLDVPLFFSPHKPLMGISNYSEGQVTVQEGRELGIYKLVKPMQPISDYRFR